MTSTIYKTSDYLSTDELHRLIRYFKKLGNLRMCLLIEFGVKTLLRYSDLSRIQWNDIIGKDTLILNEKKTGKRREISIGKTLRESIETSYNELKQPNKEELVFQYTLQHTNLLLYCFTTPHRRLVSRLIIRAKNLAEFLNRFRLFF